MLYVHRYEEVRHMCHHIKEWRGLESTKRHIANEISNLIYESNAVIVPIPSHIGYSTYTKQIAEMTGLQVIDCIKCIPHESLYERKKRGEVVEPKELQFYLDKSRLQDYLLNNRPIYIFDLVCATGTTIKAAQSLFKNCTKVVVYALDDKEYSKFN